MWSRVIRLIATCATSYWEFLLTTLKSWHRGRGCFVSPAFETTNLLHKCFPRSDSCFMWNLLWFRWNRRVLRRLVFEKLVFESSAFLPLPPSPPGPHQSAHSATSGMLPIAPRTSNVSAQSCGAKQQERHCQVMCDPATLLLRKGWQRLAQQRCAKHE